jgi:hypothetical protein
VTVKALADLGQGARGRIVELRLPPGRRSPKSPLQPGASVYVAEATGGRWLHLRIDYREYSIPLGVAEEVLIELPDREQPPSAADAYAVLVSRLARRVVRGGGGRPPAPRRAGRRRRRPGRGGVPGSLPAALIAVVEGPAVAVVLVDPGRVEVQVDRGHPGQRVEDGVADLFAQVVGDP